MEERRRRPWLRAALPWALALALLLFARVAPDAVEALYARRAYPRVAAGLGRLFGRAPVSLAELLALALVVFALARLVAALRAGEERRARLARLVRRSVAVCGWGWLAFLLLWGLCYSRPPLSERAGYPPGDPTVGELRALCADLAASAAIARRAVGEDEGGVMHLRDSRRAALARARLGFAGASAAHPFVPPVEADPKPVLLSPLMSRVGVSGIFIPFTGEANANVDVPDAQLPFVASHELAHRAGIAPEDEADYVAVLACRAHPDADFRYSGDLMALLRVFGALGAADPAARDELWDALDPAVRRDIDAIDAHWRARRSWLTSLGLGVNDLYLRAQGEAGIASYGEMVRLLVAERRPAVER